METNDQMMYSANGVRPVFPVHPGEILGEELTARGISGKEFAQMAGMQATHVSAIIHGTRNVTQPVAEKIAKVLDGISAEFWLKMQKEYNNYTQKIADLEAKLTAAEDRYYKRFGAMESMLSKINDSSSSISALFNM